MTPVTPGTPPRRRLRLVLELDADDLDEVVAALGNIACSLVGGGEERQVTSGGWASGYHLTLTSDPEQTGDRYREQLSAWSAARRAERALP